MKNENIKKINTIGKVSRIILSIMKIICVIGLVASFVGAAILVCVPNKDEFWFRGKANASIECPENSKFMLTTEKVRIGGFSLIDISDLDDLKDNHVKFMGTEINSDVETTEMDGYTQYDITADVDLSNGKVILLSMAALCIGFVAVLAIAIAILKYAIALAKAFEVCQTPFEENVITAMKKFGYSLIPLAVIYLIGGAISAPSVILILAIILFSYIFRYGAELQRESDETL